MCDYSLHSVRTRSAKVGEKLITYKFGTAADSSVSFRRDLVLHVGILGQQPQRPGQRHGCRFMPCEAYGDTNILGRWLNYAASGHGGNVLLRQRDPKTLRFTILQRVSPDMDAGDVIRLEGTWKERLHTRSPFGLNDN